MGEKTRGTDRSEPSAEPGPGEVPPEDVRSRKVESALVPQTTIAARISVIALVLVGSVLSGIFAWLQHTRTRLEGEQAFRRAADARIQAFTRHLESSIDVLRSVGSLYTTLGRMEWSDFRSFTAPILSHHPTLLAIEWIPRVPGHRRAAFEESMRVQGHVSFEIHEKTAAGERVSAGDRPEYFPVLYVEPLEPNRAAFGFDLASEKVRSLTLDLARNRRTMIATPRIRLVQLRDAGFGILVFYPVFRAEAGVAATPDRWENLAGFVLGVFSVNDLVLGSVQATTGIEALDLHLFDQSAESAEARLYPAAAASGHPADTSGWPRHQVAIEIVGRTWGVLCVPRGGGNWALDSWTPWMMCLAGFCLTALAALYLNAINRRAQVIEELVQQRTLRLSLANQALEIENAERRRLEEELRGSYRTVEETVQRRTHQLEMRNRLLRETFGLFVDDEVIERLIESPAGASLGGEKRWVSILTCDLRGFAGISERMDPHQVVEFLNRYFESMVDIIHQYRGTIADFIGDAILVIFGAPFTGADDARRACACAVAMQSGLVEVNRRSAECGLPPVEMGIGIGTGEAVVGNVGATRRRKYAAVGSIVNLAARLESLTVGGQVLLDEATRSAAGPALEVGRKFEFRAKGFSQVMVAAEVLSIGALVLPAREEPPMPLRTPLPVRCFRLDQKTLDERHFAGAVTALSSTTALLQADHAVDLRTDLVMEIPGGAGPSIRLTAKVTEVEPKGLLRAQFTGLSPEARGWIQAVLQQ